MTNFLISDDNPQGYKLEDILTSIRNDILFRATKIMEDRRPEAVAVLNNNIKILEHMAECIALAERNTNLLDKSFGPPQADQPRIGVL